MTQCPAAEQLIQELEAMLNVSRPSVATTGIKETPEQFEQSKRMAVKTRVEIELADPDDSDAVYGKGFTARLKQWALEQGLISS